jgi:site-specific recombinase, phage integrase family
MNVELKARKLSSGNKSLYIEYYETGFRKRENLGMFLIPETSAKAKRINKETLAKAQEIRADRILNPPSFDKQEPKETEGMEKAKTLTWLAWCDEYIRWSKSCGNGKDMMNHKQVVRTRTSEYLAKVGKEDILLKDVGRDEVRGLFDYMRYDYRNPSLIKRNGGKLADYTLLLFEETVKAIFNKAMREDLIAANPVHSLTKAERFHAPDKHREFLTPEELTKFLAVETATEAERTIQKAFGLSCMTGLRLSDMQQLKWNNIKNINGVLTLCTVQQKTNRPTSVPLNDLALSLLPPRNDNNPDSLVYNMVKKADWVAMYVRRIAGKAGLSKDFTYHSSRHTTATLAISAGADISTVKAILGHGSVVSTEVYAKVSLEKKIEAVNLMNGVFD